MPAFFEPRLAKRGGAVGESAVEDPDAPDEKAKKVLEEDKVEAPKRPEQRKRFRLKVAAEHDIAHLPADPGNGSPEGPAGCGSDGEWDPSADDVYLKSSARAGH